MLFMGACTRRVLIIFQWVLKFSWQWVLVFDQGVLILMGPYNRRVSMGP